MSNCFKPPIPVTATVVPGTSITYTLPTAVTAPEFGQCYAIISPNETVPLTGTEEVIINIAGTAYPLVSPPPCGGLYITAQMLKRCPCSRYRIQFGVQGTEAVMFALRGFRPRRCFVDTVTVPTP